MYQIVYADPPWQFKVYARESGLRRAPDAHYQTMPLEQIFTLLDDERIVVAPDAMLAMWVYDPMLPQALDVGRAWGFEFVTPLFRWLKAQHGTLDFFGDDKLCFGQGYHTRGGGCEEVWLFKRGKGLPVLRHDIRKEFYAPRREHSRKPDEVRTWITDLYGDHKRIELFARARADGWDCFGNETEKFGRAA